MDTTTAAEVAATTATSPGDPKFAWQDYTVFAVSLAITLCIGLVFAFVDKWHKQSAESYLMGDRNLNFLPVAMSMLASTLNAVFVVGGVAEVHYFGLEGILLVVGYLIGNLVGIFFIIPVFHSMGFQFTSAYEYFEHRFHIVVRMIGSLVFVVGILIFLAVVLYAPSIAFLQVSHIGNEYLTIFFTGGICALYTAFGGLKAVVWTDTIQMVILLAAMIAMATIGVDKAGGMGYVWNVFVASNRSVVNDIRIDFYERHSIWTTCFAYGLLWSCVLGSNQMMIQRYMSVKSKLQAQMAKFIGWLLLVVMFTLVAIIAMAGFAYYKCDPILTGSLGRPPQGDRILPYFLMDTMSEYKGFPGLIVAGFYAAALSTVSSCINSLAAVFLEDFVKPIYAMSTGHKMSSSTAGLSSRLLGLAFGVISVAIAMAAPSMSTFLVPLVVNAYAIMGAPLFGIFLLGWFFPCAESVGAITGLLVSLAVGLYLFITSLGGSRIGWHTKPLTMKGCPMSLLSRLPKPTPFPEPGISELSYLWGAPIMLAICLLLGLIVSVIVNFTKKKFTSQQMGGHINPLLLFSCSRIYCKTRDEDENQDKPGIENAGFDNSLRQMTNEGHDNVGMTKL